MNTRRLFIKQTGIMGASSLFGINHAEAQTLRKTAHIVVPFAAGGSTDVVARLLADRLRTVYAPAVVVDNKLGASGRIGIDFIRKAEADGSNMLLTPCSMMWIYPYVYKNLSYDVLQDFTPVIPVGQLSYGICVGPLVPPSVKTTTDYLQWVKVDSKNASFATGAAGATPHFIGMMLGRASGIALSHVPYKGGAAALQDVMGGQIPCSINVLSELIPQLQSGRLRLLATSGSKRSALLPDVPTLVESGFKDVVAMELVGLFVPSKTSSDTVSKLHAAVLEIEKSKDFGDAIAKLSFEPAYETVSGFSTLIGIELDRWSAVVKASGFTLEE